jgi:hypothetical protein
MEKNIKDKHIQGNAKVYGNALVYGNAKVYGNARVSGNALVSGDGKIEKTGDYLVLGPAKSSGRFTTAHKDSKIGIRVNCGCFSGTTDEFLKAIEETHRENQEALKQYRLFHALIVDNFK